MFTITQCSKNRVLHLKLNFLKIEFQNMSIFLNSFRHETFCWKVCEKRVKAHFGLTYRWYVKLLFLIFWEIMTFKNWIMKNQILTKVYRWKMCFNIKKTQKKNTRDNFHWLLPACETRGPKKSTAWDEDTDRYQLGLGGIDTLRSTNSNAFLSLLALFQTIQRFLRHRQVH